MITEVREDRNWCPFSKRGSEAEPTISGRSLKTTEQCALGVPAPSQAFGQASPFIRILNPETGQAAIQSFPAVVVGEQPRREGWQI